MSLHPSLVRQLKKVYGKYNEDDFPEDLKILLKVVSDSYVSYDEDRSMIERSLELSSKELSEKIKEIQERASETEKLNSVMVGREIKMVELKNRIKTLEERLSALEQQLAKKE